MNSTSIKKYIAECIGTFVLVFFGCGTAMLVGPGTSAGAYLLTALAFGLSIVAMAYSVGNISGCHVNPAVSLAVFITGGMSLKDFIGYVIAQFAGALTASGFLAMIWGMGGLNDATSTLVFDNTVVLCAVTVCEKVFSALERGACNHKANHSQRIASKIGLPPSYPLPNSQIHWQMVGVAADIARAKEGAEGFHAPIFLIRNQQKGGLKNMGLVLGNMKTVFIK